MSVPLWAAIPVIVIEGGAVVAMFNIPWRGVIPDMLIKLKLRKRRQNEAPTLWLEEVLSILHDDPRDPRGTVPVAMRAVYASIYIEHVLHLRALVEAHDPDYRHFWNISPYDCDVCSDKSYQRSRNVTVRAGV